MTPSSLEFDDSLSWSRQHNLSGWTALLGEEPGGENVSEYAAPARASDLSGLPPAIIQVGELDVFRDEDIAYASGLLRAGVATELHVYQRACHGFNVHVPEAAVSRRMTADTLAALARALLRPARIQRGDRNVPPRRPPDRRVRTPRRVRRRPVAAGVWNAGYEADLGLRVSTAISLAWGRVFGPAEELSAASVDDGIQLRSLITGGYP